MLQRLALCVALCIAVSSAHAQNGDWVLSADARFAGALEQRASAASDRSVYVPYASLVAGRRLGPAIAYGKLRAGLPVLYGQIGAGLGLALEAELEASSLDVGLRQTLGFVALEAGGTGTFFDAPPEIHYYPDAVLYWGPYARVELGVRVLVHKSAARSLGLVTSLAVETTWAHYSHPEGGAGLRVGADLGLGGELRF